MINRGDPIQLSDLTSVGSLATTKLSPTTPFSFPPVSDTLLPPATLTGAVDYTAGNYLPGGLLLVRIYSYKTISGTKTYSSRYTIGSVTTVAAGHTQFKVTWTWPAASGVDGYILTAADQPCNANIPYPGNYGGQFWDVGSVTTVLDTFDTTTPKWKKLFGAESGSGVSAYYNSPVDNGPYLNELSRIRHYLFAPTPLGISQVDTRSITDSWLVSGPWCVAAGTACQAYIKAIYNGATLVNITPVKTFKNLALYTEHSSDLPTLTQALPTPTVSSGTVSGASSITDTWAFTGVAGVINGTVVYTLAETNTGTDGRFPHVGNYTVSITGTGISYVFSSPDAFTGVFTFTFTNVSVASSVVISITSPVPIGAATYVSRSVTSMTWTYVYVSGGTSVKGISTSGAMYKIGNLPDSKFTYELSGTYNTIPFDSGVVPFYPQWVSTYPGAWVARTLPAWNLYTMLTQDLPQYLAPGNLDKTRETCPVPKGVAVEAGRSWPSVWPVFRDTDFGSWRNGDGNALPTGPIPFWPNDPFHVFSAYPNNTVASLTMFPLTALVIDSTMEDMKLVVTDPSLVLYVLRGSEPDTSTFDFRVTGGALSLKALLGGSLASWVGQLVWVGVFNPGPAPASFDGQLGVYHFDNVGGYPGDTPVFFPINTDHTPQAESFSYSQNLVGSSGWASTAAPIPLLGYCVYDLVLRMPASDNGNGILIPTVAPAAGGGQSVDIGLMIGTTDVNPGTFQLLQTFVIPTGQSQLRTSVFWPVTSGAALAYRSSEVITVLAGTNYQPWTFTDTSGNPWYVDRYCQGQNNFGSPANYPKLVFPIFSDIINDLNGVLSLL